MSKHKYKAIGIINGNRQAECECIALDMIEAIKHMQNIGLSVQSITKKEQVSAEAELGITRLTFDLRLCQAEALLT